MSLVYSARKVRSFALGPPMATGGNSEIFTLQHNLVLKLLDEGISEAEARKEIMMTSLAHSSGANVPKVSPELVRDLDTGRSGIVLEQVQGTGLDTIALQAPHRLGWICRRFAVAQSQIHRQQAVAGIEPQRQWIGAHIERARCLSVMQRKQALALLESLPDGDRLCHGDLHLGNVMDTGRGEIVIDWLNALSGEPCGDVARSWVVLRFPTRADLIERWYLRLLLPFYLRAYRRCSGDSLQLLRQWILVGAVARLGEFNEREHVAGLEAFARRLLGRAPG